MAAFLTLDDMGLALAFLVGLAILLLGEGYGAFFVLLIFIFLIISAIVTHAGRVKKSGIGIYERSRGWKNVFSNGAGPLILAAVFFVNTVFAFLPTYVVALGYVASVAAVLSDKFGSELGVLDGEPRMLLTGKHVKKGTSGGVTALGLGASLAGSFMIALGAFYVVDSPAAFAVVFVAGFMGSLVDSALGYYEEKGIGNKYTSNFVCSVAAAVVAIAAFSLL